jgi:aminopeptidase N
VNAQDESIAGYTTVKIRSKTTLLDTIELDLIDNYLVSKIEINNKQARFVHKGFKILIFPNTPTTKDQILAIKISYSGKPPEARRAPWNGGFVWKKDTDDNDWVGLACQGEGAKIWFPCKDHPSDEPDSAAINITVPQEYYVAANGLLKNETYSGDGYKTYHWFTGYPINNYLINFGIGKFDIIEKKYTTNSGYEMPVEFYVLPQMRSGADSLLDQAIDMLKTYRKFYGEYPWTKEKFGLLNTSFLGMEHQTLIAYGNRYHNRKIADISFDQLLLHEIGHEWWGNKITIKDWADFWIQEGICTYGEALYALDKSGKKAYHEYVARFQKRIRNRSPLILGKNITSEEAYNGDIYSKGAAFMHTLRFVLGDSIFFPTLKQFATDSAYIYPNFVNTVDLLELVNKNLGLKLDSLFNLYLYTTGYPEIKIDSLSSNVFTIAIPNINFELPMEVTLNGRIDTLLLGKKSITVNTSSRPIVDAQNWYLKNVLDVEY